MYSSTCWSLAAPVPGSLSGAPQPVNERSHPRPGTRNSRLDLRFGGAVIGNVPKGLPAAVRPGHHPTVPTRHGAQQRPSVGGQVLAPQSPQSQTGHSFLPGTTFSPSPLI